MTLADFIHCVLLRVAPVESFIDGVEGIEFDVPREGSEVLSDSYAQVSVAVGNHEVSFSSRHNFDLHR